jgi:hypothetical protein
VLLFASNKPRPLRHGAASPATLQKAGDRVDLTDEKDSVLQEMEDAASSLQSVSGSQENWSKARTVAHLHGRYDWSFVPGASDPADKSKRKAKINEEVDKARRRSAGVCPC